MYNFVVFLAYVFCLYGIETIGIDFAILPSYKLKKKIPK